jgi:PTH1 family peptidyl-tRNA hydrolase
MKLFVGLGNPGEKYRRNRHNIGFMVLDHLAERGFSPWKAKFQGRIAKGRVGAEKVVLLKPETFMNLSGQAVGEAMRYYKLTPDDITVFHDELDLAPGKIKLKTGGGHAGHNGLRSLHQHIGPDYTRLRIGIGHPGHKDKVARYVLHDFAKSDTSWIDPLLQGIETGLPHLAAGEGPKFLNAVALRLSPPRPSSGKKKPAAQPKAKPPAQEDDRTPMQRLKDRFS